MMEALAIGLGLLAGYSVAATVGALYWWRASEGWRKAAWEATMTTEDWVQRSWELEDEAEAMEAYLAPSTTTATESLEAQSQGGRDEPLPQEAC